VSSTELPLSSGSLFSQVEAYTSNNKVPPVESWNPALSGDMDLIIRRDGTWIHEGEPILRESLIALFASILKREGEEYFLVTPVEKWRITVEDAPFLIQAVETAPGINGESFLFKTNVGEPIVLSAEHALWVQTDSLTGEPSPYIAVRRNLNALISRSVFYELVDKAVLKGKELVLETDVGGFVLGEV